MACPHGAGAPESCSQCVGAKPRRVDHDPKTGALTVNGKPAGRPFQLPTHGRNGPARRPKS